jgi:hypothetical protein
VTWFEQPENEAAALDEHAITVDFVDIDFPTGHLRLHTWVGQIIWGTNLWEGVGKLGEITGGEEDAEMRPVSFSMRLSGVDAALVQAARSEEYHGRTVRVYRGWFNRDTGVLVATPEQRRVGLIDSMRVSLGLNTGSITVTCETELARWQRPRGLLYTHESQQLLYPGDRGFDMVPTIQTRVLDWSEGRTLFGFPIGGWINQIIQNMRPR